MIRRFHIVRRNNFNDAEWPGAEYRTSGEALQAADDHNRSSETDDVLLVLDPNGNYLGGPERVRD